MFLNELPNQIQFPSAEAPGPLESNGFQPEFRDHALASDVNVRRFAPIQGHKEKALGPYSENRRHSIATLSTN